MSPLPVSGPPSGGASPETPKPSEAGDRRDMERFGLMLWLALSGSSRAMGPGAGSDWTPGRGPVPDTGGRGGEPERSADLPAARTAVSRTAAAEPLAGRGDARPGESTGDTGRRSGDGSRAGVDRAGRTAARDASPPPAEKSDGGSSPAQAASTEAGRRGRAGEGARAARVLNGVSATAGNAGRNQAAAAYRALLPGAKTAAAPAAGPAAFTRLLQAQAARLTGTGARGNGTVSIAFQDALGAQGRIRLALRGGVLQTTIISTNPETVRSLGSGIGELRGALAEQGFADPQITVRDARPQEFDAPRPDRGDEPPRDRDERSERRQNGDDTSSGEADGFRIPDEEA